MRENYKFNKNKFDELIKNNGMKHCQIKIRVHAMALI